MQKQSHHAGAARFGDFWGARVWNFCATRKTACTKLQSVPCDDAAALDASNDNLHDAFEVEADNRPDALTQVRDRHFSQTLECILGHPLDPRQLLAPHRVGEEAHQHVEKLGGVGQQVTLSDAEQSIEPLDGHLPPQRVGGPALLRDDEQQLLIIKPACTL
jgi:hypothetical protein